MDLELQDPKDRFDIKIILSILFEEKEYIEKNSVFHKRNSQNGTNITFAYNKLL